MIRVGNVRETHLRDSFLFSLQNRVSFHYPPRARFCLFGRTELKKSLPTTLSYRVVMLIYGERTVAKKNLGVNTDMRW